MPPGSISERVEVLAKAGKRLTARDLSLIAAGDVPEVTVRRRPRIALAATGDELTLPGAPKTPGGIVASSGYGLSPLIAGWGGEVVDLGIVPDTVEAVAALPQRAAGADLLVTLGGASVGEHDLIQKALGPAGLRTRFLEDRDAPGQAADLRPARRTAADRPAGQSGVDAGLRPALSQSPPSPRCWAPTPPRRLRARAWPHRSRPMTRAQDYIRATREIRDGEVWVTPVADPGFLDAVGPGARRRA